MASMRKRRKTKNLNINRSLKNSTYRGMLTLETAYMPKRTTPRLNKASLIFILILSLNYASVGIGNEISAKAVISVDLG